MIKFRLKIGGCKVADSWLTFVGPLLLIASSAQAGAWEEFETRCLKPMEDVSTPITDGLVKAEMAENAEKTATTYQMDLRNPDTLFFLISSKTQDQLTCGMTNVEIGETPQDAVRDLVASGRYVLVGAEGEQRYVLATNEWREPVLRVELRSDGTSVTWVALDTDLEG